MLLLECVKELEDAFVLMEVLQQHSLPLLQVRDHQPNCTARLLWKGIHSSGIASQPGSVGFLTAQSNRYGLWTMLPVASTWQLPHTHITAPTVACCHACAPCASISSAWLAHIPFEHCNPG